MRNLNEILLEKLKLNKDIAKQDTYNEEKYFLIRDICDLCGISDTNDFDDDKKKWNNRHAIINTINWWVDSNKITDIDVLVDSEDTLKTPKLKGLSKSFYTIDSKIFREYVRECNKNDVYLHKQEDKNDFNIIKNKYIDSYILINKNDWDNEYNGFIVRKYDKN